MLRLFSAVLVPEDGRATLSLLQSGIPGARWIDEHNFHVTLRFFGEVTETQGHDIHDQLTRVRAPGFWLDLDGVGHFGTAKRPDALWAGLTRSEELGLLRAKVDRAAVMAGLPPEDRKFHPHVTLGRLRQAPNERVARWLAEHALFRWGPFRVDRFCLMRSYLGNEGSVYEVLEEYDLAANLP